MVPCLALPAAVAAAGAVSEVHFLWAVLNEKKHINVTGFTSMVFEISKFLSSSLQQQNYLLQFHQNR